MAVSPAIPTDCVADEVSAALEPQPALFTESLMVPPVLLFWLAADCEVTVPVLLLLEEEACETVVCPLMLLTDWLEVLEELCPSVLLRLLPVSDSFGVSADEEEPISDRKSVV